MKRRRKKEEKGKQRKRALLKCGSFDMPVCVTLA
jgi:hypothetical protein